MSRSLATLLDEHRGLGLLLALSSSGCLGLPRFEGEPDDDADTGDETFDSTTAGPTTTTLTTGPTTSTTTTGPTTTSTSTTTSTTTSPTVTTTPPPILDVGTAFYGCQAYAEVMTSCYGDRYGENAYQFCVEYMTYLAEQSPQCVPILDAFFVCLSQQPCDELFGPECEALLDVFFDCQA